MNQANNGKLWDRQYYILAPYSWGVHSHIDTIVTDATAVGQ